VNWLDNRRRMEERIIRERRRQNVDGERYHPSFNLVNGTMTTVFGMLGLIKSGRRNAVDFRIHRLEMTHPALPDGFDGYTLLFLSDLHAASVPEVLVKAAARIPELKFEVAVLGGDYQCFGVPSAKETCRFMAPLLSALRAKAPIYGVLGNHDRHDLPPEMEQHGVEMLINRHVVLERGGDRLILVGLDDIHAFYSEAAPAALRQLPEGFRIAVIHSPEFAEQAAAAGVSLYLAGHTHGGQVCLPGGRPIITAMERRHDPVAVAQWNCHGMRGYTSSGLGSGTPPVRFNCRPEMVLITLRRG
jgi:predicted MPP superfamily phosphohydrolase